MARRVTSIPPSFTWYATIMFVSAIAVACAALLWLTTGTPWIERFEHECDRHSGIAKLRCKLRHMLTTP